MDEYQERRFLAFAAEDLIEIIERESQPEFLVVRPVLSLSLEQFYRRFLLGDEFGDDFRNTDLSTIRRSTFEGSASFGNWSRIAFFKKGAWGCEFWIGYHNVQLLSECVALILNLNREFAYYKLSLQQLSMFDESMVTGMLGVSELDFVACEVSPLLSRALASRPVKNDLELGFFACELTDDFVLCLQELNYMSIAIGELHLCGSNDNFAVLPGITPHNVQQLLALPLRKEIILEGFFFDDTYSAAFETIRVDNLVLAGCYFEGIVPQLAGAIANNHGPRTFSFYFPKLPVPPPSPAMWQQFCWSLTSPLCSLQNFQLAMDSSDDGSSNPLAHFAGPLVLALASNTTLVEFGLQYHGKMHLWTEIFQSLHSHPSLLTLDVSAYRNGAPYLVSQLSDLLRSNDNIENVTYSYMYDDETEWNTRVAPLLERNVYRKKFRSLTVITRNTWNGVLAKVMGSVSSRPTPLWMLMSENQALIVDSIVRRANVGH